MTSARDPDSIPENLDVVLPDDGVVDLSDQLTGYMTEIELGGLPDILAVSYTHLTLPTILLV